MDLLVEKTSRSSIILTTMVKAWVATCTLKGTVELQQVDVVCSFLQPISLKVKEARVQKQGIGEILH